MENQSWWGRVRKFEPARVRYVIVLVVSMVALWGFDISGVMENVAETWALAYQALTVIVTGEVIRQGVSPAKTIVTKESKEGGLEPGPARQDTGDEFEQF